ncbi:MAG: CBS domain-containing protein [Bacteroidota bacterium]
MKPIREMLESRPVYSISRYATVQEAAEFMAARNIGAVSVMEGDRLVGIFSERDVINRVVAKHLDPGRVRVDEVMTREIVVGDASDTCDDCLRKMKGANCRHLPIVEGDRLLGMISLRDLLQVDINEKEDKIEFLTNYMFHVSPDTVKRYRS